MENLGVPEIGSNVRVSKKIQEAYQNGQEVNLLGLQVERDYEVEQVNPKGFVYVKGVPIGFHYQWFEKVS